MVLRETRRIETRGVCWGLSATRKQSPNYDLIAGYAASRTSSNLKGNTKQFGWLSNQNLFFLNDFGEPCNHRNCKRMARPVVVFYIEVLMGRIEAGTQFSVSSLRFWASRSWHTHNSTPDTSAAPSCSAACFGNGDVFLHHRSVRFKQRRLVPLQKLFALIRRKPKGHPPCRA
jgi:hypothetical protein